MEKKNIPQIIQDVGFDFRWKSEKVWQLDVPTAPMNIEKLTWHFDIPFLRINDGAYNLTPRAVMESPEQYSQEYERTMKADMQYPIDIMENKGRWLILDGLHRLMQASIKNLDTVNVRVIPREKIPDITA